MAITSLNHYFVRAKDLTQTKQFYVDVLGLTEMLLSGMGQCALHNALGLFKGNAVGCVHDCPLGVAWATA